LTGFSDATFWAQFFALPWPFIATIIVTIAAVWMAWPQASAA